VSAAGRVLRRERRGRYDSGVKAVFLDRDNTLIENDGDLGDPALVRLREGVAESLRSLREQGYRLIVVTNQGGVARGAYTERDVDAVHERIAQLVDEVAGAHGVIDRFYYCPYHPEGTVEEYRREHRWRKPQPGMLLQAARDLGLDLSQCWMIGDQPRDIEAGRAAGCRTILLSRGEEVANEDEADATAQPSLTMHTFSDAAAAILRSRAIGASTQSDEGPAASRTSFRSASMMKARDTADSTRPTAKVSSDRGEEHETFEPLRRAVHDLAEEYRADRLRRTEFTPLRMAAGMCQLLVLLCAMLAILQLGQFESFVRWMLGGALLQLAVIAILLWDAR